MTISTFDLFTADETEIYQDLLAKLNEISAQRATLKPKDLKNNPDYIRQCNERSCQQNKLAEQISKHAGTPRNVQLDKVLDYKYFTNEDGEISWPAGVTWWTLKMSKRIAEFSSEESRAMGLNHQDITFDKIIVKWKSLDLLEQLVKDGFVMPILQPDGSLIVKKYRVATASAGQQRTDKIQCVSEDMWAKIHKQLECGMDWETLNTKGGINVNKLLAYQALPCSATDEWNDVTIDECIVIKDFEAPVTGVLDFIEPNYTMTRGIRTVNINHTDGIGMMLPSVSRSNFMVRAPWIKGLLTSFDYLEFCKHHDIEPVIEDYWGVKHHLAEENIRVIFTESQFKLAKYYDDWDHYKRCFKECGCHQCATNYEEDYIADTYLNYQMIQTLTDFSDREIDQFIRPTKQKIESISEDKDTMLRVLNAEENSDSPYRQALYFYPELLREAYARNTLKDIKRRWVQDARSGKIKCRNKRLFAIPDMYAACEFWFLGIKEPHGQLQDGEVACKVYEQYDKADVLRSPHQQRCPLAAMQVE